MSIMLIQNFDFSRCDSWRNLWGTMGSTVKTVESIKHEESEYGKGSKPRSMDRHLRYDSSKSIFHMHLPSLQHVKSIRPIKGQSSRAGNTSLVSKRTSSGSETTEGSTHGESLFYKRQAEFDQDIHIVSQTPEQ